MARDWWTYAIVAGTATVAVTGVGFLAYSYWSEYNASDEASTSGKEDADAAARLRAARGIQMQALPRGPSGKASSNKAPQLPVRSTPRQSPASATSAKPATGSKAPAAAPSARKTCAYCSKPTTGLPLRCSGCKQVYYCKQECQKKAWSEHKLVCKATSSAAASGTSNKPAACSSPRSHHAPVAAPVAAAAVAAVESDAVSSSHAAVVGMSSADEAAPAEEPKDFQSALAMYLDQQAKANTDELEAHFERSVMLFVQAKYRACLSALENVKDMAIQRGNKNIQGEVYKWMGHAHNRLTDSKQAQAHFEAGAYFAKHNELPKLEIDCLGGLGCMYRAQGESVKAVTMLEQALTLAETNDDEDSKASTLCNLGAALMPIDSVKALKCLHEAVNLREQAIEKLHRAGERQGLATAVMEHANALVNLASALLISKRLPEAEACYVRALEVFELVEDVDKVVKVLINLANMKELQVHTALSRQEASLYRQKLLDFMQAHGVRHIDDTCTVCLEHFATKAVSEPGKELILLACLHCLHNSCWEKWAATHTCDKGVECPTCKQVVPLVLEP